MEAWQSDSISNGGAEYHASTVEDCACDAARRFHLGGSGDDVRSSGECRNLMLNSQGCLTDTVSDHEIATRRAEEHIDVRNANAFSVIASLSLPQRLVSHLSLRIVSLWVRCGLDERVEDTLKSCADQEKGISSEPNAIPALPRRRKSILCRLGMPTDGGRPQLRKRQQPGSVLQVLILNLFLSDRGSSGWRKIVCCATRITNQQDSSWAAELSLFSARFAKADCPLRLGPNSCTSQKAACKAAGGTSTPCRAETQKAVQIICRHGCD